MEISTKTFSELDKLELYQLLALRAEVFVVEQDCAYQDVDGKDLKALHVRKERIWNRCLCQNIWPRRLF